ncbi:hypothetical protein F511_46777 [Dorcoceras hygrometricum]|uniref:Uncharacterized protein n=1 Tax=Dorcoceras hygrometricum TaxID=472368 RepID=A0A2Z6ZT86_9LAMI|nr:hypothetical protein F511_46777 [Dorcoceras hygrometricum]
MRARSLAHCARRWPCPGASCAIVGHTLADQLRAMVAGREATLLRVTAETSRDKEARWPHVPRLLPLLVEDVRRLNARWPCDRRVLDGLCRATLAVEACCCARRRALPPLILVVVAPPAGRCSGEFPAMS